MATKLKKLLGKEAYWTINKDLARKIGLEQTLVLQHIIDLTESAFKRDEIFQPISEMKDELGISEFSVKKAIKELSDRKFINVIRKGIPFKNYYSVNERTIMEFLFAPTIEMNSTQYSENTESPNYSDENDISIEVNPTQQQGENTVAITNNTTKEYNKNTELTYTKQMLERIIDKFISVDNRFKYNSVMIEINEDYGGFENLLEMYLPGDTSAQRNFKNKLNQYQDGIFA